MRIEGTLYMILTCEQTLGLTHKTAQDRVLRREPEPEPFKVHSSR